MTRCRSPSVRIAALEREQDELHRVEEVLVAAALATGQPPRRPCSASGRGQSFARRLMSRLSSRRGGKRTEEAIVAGLAAPRFGEAVLLWRALVRGAAVVARLWPGHRSTPFGITDSFAPGDRAQLVMSRLCAQRLSASLNSFATGSVVATLPCISAQRLSASLNSFASAL
jgi:hypothetical protein